MPQAKSIPLIEMLSANTAHANNSTIIDEFSWVRAENRGLYIVTLLRYAVPTKMHGVWCDGSERAARREMFGL